MHRQMNPRLHNRGFKRNKTISQKNTFTAVVEKKKCTFLSASLTSFSEQATVGSLHLAQWAEWASVLFKQHTEGWRVIPWWCLGTEMFQSWCSLTTSLCIVSHFARLAKPHQQPLWGRHPSRSGGAEGGSGRRRRREGWAGELGAWSWANGRQQQ